MEEEFNLTSNSTDYIYHHEENFYERLFLELFTLVALISLVANFFIVFVIVKYKRLRQDVTNIILAHLNILQAVYLVISPLTLRVSMAFDFFTLRHLRTFCVFREIETVITIAICLFLFLLVCDWYLKLYSEDKYVKFCRVYKFLVVSFYIVVVFFVALMTQFCLRDLSTVYAIIASFAGYVFVVVFLFIMNIIHKIKKRRLLNTRRNNVGLAITNIFFLLWCPSFIITLFSIIGLHSPIVIIVFITLGFSSPIFNFAYLFYYDDNFNIFFKQVFKCQCNDYENETLEDQSVTYNDVSGIQFTES